MRIIARWVPGFIWVQFIVTARWKFGSWPVYRGLVHTHAFGPLRLVTMREGAKIGADR